MSDSWGMSSNSPPGDGPFPSPAAQQRQGLPPFENPPVETPPFAARAAAPASGAAPASSRGTRLLFWGGLVLMLLAATALIVDWASRNYEMSQLLTAIEASEAQMAQAQDGIIEVELPPDPSPEQIEKAGAELRSISAAGSDAVAEAGLDVGAVAFLPWHADMVSAQSAYRAHNQAWVDYLAKGAKDPQDLFGSNNAIEPTWRRAEFQVREAVPPLAWPDISQRVDEIFTDDANSDPGGSVDV